MVALIGERGRELSRFRPRCSGARRDGACRRYRGDFGHVPAGAAALRLDGDGGGRTLSRRRGWHVLFLADSITRFAEAHREIATVSGELPVLRGFPASTRHLITSLCERAGPGCDPTGDITAVFSVLVAGSDMEEPIADILRGVLDGHVVLDREIAERGRFPAIDVLRSVSRSLPGAA